MASHKTPITFAYRKDGAQPPVYIAGSFSDPSWQPQEMDASMDQHGEYSFTKEVQVADASEIQYKFRIGSGDWWTIDPSADTVTDSEGNVNNVLKVSPDKPSQDIVPAEVSRVRALKESASPSGIQTPDFARTAAEVADSANLLDPATPEPTMSDEEAGRAGVRRLSSTPITEVACTAAEVAEDAAKLDSDDSETAVHDDGNDYPMFSHECLGAPEINIQAPGSEEPSHHSTEEKTPDQPIKYPDESEIDLDDPQLEHFPSENRDSIMAAMRRLSTSIDADRTVVEGISPSPVVSASRQQVDDVPHKKLSELPNEDQSNHVEDTECSPDLAHSVVAPETAASLQSIVEDDEVLNDVSERNGTPSQLVQHSGPASKPEVRPEPVGSDDDEGIAMYNPSYKGSVKGQQDDSTCQASDTHDSKAAESDMEESAQDDTTFEPEDKSAAAIDDISPKTIPADDALTSNTSAAACTEPVINEDITLGADGTETSEARLTSLDACSQTNMRKHTNGDRPDSPSSTRSLNNVQKDGKWLKALLHTILVDWIGGLLLLLCGRNNRALSAAGTGATLVGVGVLWWARRDRVQSIFTPLWATRR